MGVITGFTLTPANGSEREATWDVIGGIQGLLIGDKGYISEELGEQLFGYDINLQTPLRSNMKDQRDKSFGQLTHSLPSLNRDGHWTTVRKV